VFLLQLSLKALSYRTHRQIVLSLTPSWHGVTIFNLLLLLLPYLQPVSVHMKQLYLTRVYIQPAAQRSAQVKAESRILKIF
jgi:hypothetical protein